MSEPTSSDSATGGLAPDEQRRAVRRRYARIASESSGCADETDASGCCDGDGTSEDDLNRQLGYSEDETSAVADGANLGLGCGNPTAIASLRPGETVLDLGSGAGFDCFLAAQEVGDDGHVIGVDMTPEMVEKARENVEKNEATNVEFRLGEIEHLPVADETVDTIISNCVVNLSPAKQQVFHESYRALRPGGRLAISDVVLTAELPEEVHDDAESVASCIAGASPIPELERMLSNAGFEQVRIESKEESKQFISEWDDERDVSEYVVSATIEAVKPPR
ncbi:arsenite methyltransferase [Haloferax sp. MBLA0076]|uniref:Arsenite methyltransferase n=1 Tax=Haloferax litoreum TaxID=2666140 RepID=A0A6A8GDI9_9EURY|nr:MULTISPECIES: arsenite methyltransferase [Haloferax]KAB1192689.1 arsenite methyltransferase [Haloferax sp. CBA1148]MRX21165.1 arsenite methyltransferase [Haloferax litoreum]